MEIEDKKEIFIYHHLGLGDHITCHGIVRYYAEIYEKVNLFVKPKYFENIEYMYNDLQNLNLIRADDIAVMWYLKTYNPTNVLYIGGVTINGYDANKLSEENGNFEEQFYKMADLPFEYKYSKFYINRNINKEMQLFNTLGLKEGEYIFAHTGGTQLKEDSIINKGFRIVSPDTHAFFDWIYVIENAKEIHCMDSSYLCLIDCLNLDKKIDLFNHRYIRGYPDFIKVSSNKDWKVIK